MVSIKKLHKSYKMGDSSLHVLKGIDLNIKEGEMVAIMGGILLIFIPNFLSWFFSKTKKQLKPPILTYFLQEI